MLELALFLKSGRFETPSCTALGNLITCTFYPSIVLVGIEFAGSITLLLFLAYTDTDEVEESLFILFPFVIQEDTFKTPRRQLESTTVEAGLVFVVIFLELALFLKSGRFETPSCAASGNLISSTLPPSIVLVGL